MTTLHLVAGIAGSKREEKVKEIAEKTGSVIVSAQAIRTKNPELKNNQVFEKAHAEIKEFLEKEISVVFDATNTIKKQRVHLKNMMKGYKMICYYVLSSVEDCIEKDKESERPVGEEMVLRNFFTAEVPFKSEGWDEIYYFVDDVDETEKVILTSMTEPLPERFKELTYTTYFIESAKELLENSMDEKLKKVGFNNGSAQRAFQALFSIGEDMETIKNVVNLIVFKKRFLGTDEKGKEKMKEQLGENLYSKLVALTKETA